MNSLPQPVVVSGYRSPEYQRSLQERWDRGEREGLSVRPATHSRHSDGLAFDLGNDEWVLYYFGPYAERRGGRWGGRFLTPDVGHFEVI